jgi:hypothetical protein
MNSSDFEVLKQGIAIRLYEKGPATSETIAFELQAPSSSHPERTAQSKLSRVSLLAEITLPV